MSEVVVQEGDRGPVISNGLVRVAVHANRGTFSIESLADALVARLDDASVSLAVSNQRGYSTRGIGFIEEGTMPVSDAQGRGTALRLRREAEEHEPELAVTIALYEGCPFAVIQADAANSTSAPLRVDAFHVVDSAVVVLPSPAEGWRFYKEGWQSWSPSLVLAVSGEDVHMAPPVAGSGVGTAPAPGRFRSETVGAIADPAGGEGLVAGFISTADQLAQVEFERETSTVSAVSYADGIQLPPGGRLSSERLLAQLSSRPYEALQRYADALAAEMNAPRRFQAVSGWCSWYHYYWRVSEDDIISNLDQLAARRRELPLEYVQIDDGYQTGIGDWLTANEKFPHGMASLADEIHRRGFKAGIWLAPFLIGEKSDLWQQHPDWAVRYKEDRPYIAALNWMQQCYALDLTRDDVIAWLEDIFRTICGDWGYDYLKVDFLYAGAVNGIRHNPDITRAQAYRRGLEAIRRAAGERFILGCGNPLGPSVGLVDGSRIGPDVSPWWHPRPAPLDPERTGLSRPSTLNSIRNVILRSWMHGRLWLNDPDCLIVRETDTELTVDEIRTLTTVIGLSGGMVLDSDDLASLTEERRRLISLALPAYDTAATPVDFFQSDIPRRLELDCGSHRIVAVFNWDEETAEVRVRLPDGESVHVYDFWSGRYLGLRSKQLALDLPPHGCTLLRLTLPIDRSLLVGSTFHLTQGRMELFAEEWHGLHHRIQLLPVAVREGEVTIWAPPKAGAPRTEDAEVVPLNDGAWALKFRLDEPKVIDLRY
ncbi:MAG: alpha-galactosidase [Chloroflexi bacterium]|nr:MAG: alpha-galactosidase [Chloroflexota bacterium]